MWTAGAKQGRAEPSWVKIAHALLVHGPQPSMGELAPLVVGLNGGGLTANTVRRLVGELEREDRFLLRDPVRFGPGTGYVLGVSLGSESMRAALFDANGEMAEASCEVEPGVGHELDRHAAEAEPEPDQLLLPRAAILDRIALLAQRVAFRAVRDKALLVDDRLPLLGVAVAWPTPLNRWTKRPTGRSLRDPSWRVADEHGQDPKGLDVLVAERLRLPLKRSHALNDANALALAAAFEACREELPDEDRLGGTVMALRIGGGLGVGTVVIGVPPDDRPRSRFLHARLLEGSGGYAGELGHWQVPEEYLTEVFGPEESAPDEGRELVRPRARRCTCERDCCLETFASASAFVERMRLSGIAVAGLKEGRARAKTSVMHEVMRNVEDTRQLTAQKDIGRLIGCSLSSPILMLNPDRVVLSGSMAVEAVKDGIEEEKSRWRHVHEAGLDMQLLKGRESKYAAARGAALAAFRGQLYRRFDDDRVDRSRLTMPLGAEQIAAWHDSGALAAHDFERELGTARTELV